MRWGNPAPRRSAGTRPGNPPTPRVASFAYSAPYAPCCGKPPASCQHGGAPGCRKLRKFNPERSLRVVHILWKKTRSCIRAAPRPARERRTTRRSARGDRLLRRVGRRLGPPGGRVALLHVARLDVPVDPAALVQLDAPSADLPLDDARGLQLQAALGDDRPNDASADHGILGCDVAEDDAVLPDDDGLPRVDGSFDR